MFLVDEDSGESGFRSLLSRWLGLDRSSSAGGGERRDPAGADAPRHRLRSRVRRRQSAAGRL